VAGDALVSLKRLRREGRTFDIIFLDPPYASALGEEALSEVVSILAPDGVAILEHGARKAPPEVSGLQFLKTRRFGDTSISVYQRKQEDSPDALGGE